MGANLTFNDNDDVQIKGATDATLIGNIGNKLRTGSTLYDSGGTEAGTSANPLNVAVSLSYAPDLIAGRLFAASAQVNATSGGSDNPLLLLRNPVGSAKNFFIYRIDASVEVTNTAVTYKVFGSPVFSSTVANITTITQAALSTTVTVTTATNHNATVGATAVIAGTTNFNGSWAVASVTSATVYTFTKTAPLITTTENTGTSTVASSLGGNVNEYPLKRVASPTAAVGIVTTAPTVSSNGDQLLAYAQGQNSSPPLLIEAAQISLEPGQALLVTGNPSSNNRSSAISIVWSEVPQ